MTTEKTFIAYWGEGYGNPEAEIVRGIASFTDEKNYNEECREELERLEVTEVCDLSDICGTHYVIRVG